MQRLLADAQKITGVKYDINNLSDVYSAIHVIQGELDITGTTAKEASSTISGSMAAMKSAFKNVLGQLTLGQDIGPALQGLAETVTTFLAGNLIPAVWNIISTLPGTFITFIQTALPQLVSAFMQFIPQLQTGITAGLPQMLQIALQLLDGFVGSITTNLPQVLQSGVEILNGLVDGILDSLPSLAQTALTTLTEFINSIIANFPLILESGKNILMNIVDGIRQSFPEIIKAAGQAIVSLISGIITHLPEIIDSGFDLIVCLIQGIGEALPDVIAAAGDVLKAIWDTIMEVDWLQLGKDVISGLINGIGAMAGALWDAAVNIAKSGLDAIKSFFGIASPSRVMRDQVGKFIPEGIALGIEQNTNPISRAMHDITDLTADTAMNLQYGLSAGTKWSASSFVPATAGGVSLYQTINTHDSLSPAEMTREAENFLTRSRWKNP